MEGHAKRCVEKISRIGEQNNSTVTQSRNSMYKRPSIQGRRNRICWRIVKSMLTIVLKCLYSARIGRLDILWSVNELARSITKWTRACDKRSARLISYIHDTCEFKQYCHVENIAQQCRSGLFQDSDFAGDLEDSKSTSGGPLCIFGSQNICPNKLDVQETDFGLTQLNRSRAKIS